MLSCFPALAQNQSASFVWNSSDHCCKVIYEDGRAREQFIDERVLIEVYPPTAYDKHSERARIIVYNGQHSTSDLDVNPAAVAASADDPAHTILHSASGDQILAKEERSANGRNALASALQGFGAGMESHTATVNNPDGSTSTVTYHDPNDQRQANEDAATRASDIRNHYSSLSGTVLRRNTVRPGNFVEGYVYFARPKGLDKKIPLNAIAIYVAERTYIFPFEKGLVPDKESPK